MLRSWPGYSREKNPEGETPTHGQAMSQADGSQPQRLVAKGPGFITPWLQLYWGALVEPQPQLKMDWGTAVRYFPNFSLQVLKSKLFPRQWKPQDSFAAPRKAGSQVRKGEGGAQEGARDDCD